MKQNPDMNGPEVTLWDHFFSCALQRIYAGNMVTKPEQVAIDAANYADAALKERNKRLQEQANAKG